ELQCTLATGALPCTYAATYTTTVDVDATGSVGNSVVATGGGDDDPECDPCGTEHEVEAAVITTTKTADPPSGTEVRVGDVLTYTVTVTVANSATTAAFVLDDTLGAGQVLLVDSVQAPEGATCEGAATTLQCILAPGALPGSHVFSYQARVEPGAAGEVGNVVVPSGGGGELADCETCATNHPMADPVVNIAKASDPGDGAEVMVGDRIAYSIAVSIEHAALIAPLQVTDVPGPGLRIDAPPEGCVASGDGFTCTLGTGTVPGTYVFDYWATIGPDAFGDVENLVLG